MKGNSIKSVRKFSKIALVIFFLGILVIFPSTISAQGPNVDISVSASIAGSDDDPPTPPPPPASSASSGGSTVVITPFPGQVIIEGKTSPEALVTFKINNETAGTVVSDSSGNFQKKIDGLFGGTYHFAVFSEDSKGRLSSTFNLTAPVFTNKTTYAKGVVLSPTYSVFPEIVSREENVFLFGKSFPGSKVNIFVSKGKQTKFINAFSSPVNAFGQWLYIFNTGNLSAGWHQVSAFVISPDGEHSPFSLTQPFFVKTPEVPVTEPPPPDLIPKIEIPTGITPDIPIIDPPEIPPDSIPTDPRDVHPEKSTTSVVLFVIFFIILFILVIFFLWRFWRQREEIGK